MDEKERLKRRKRALQNAGHRSRRVEEVTYSAKDLFCFRIYVTVIIVGLTIALSFMPSASTKALTGNLKQAIAHKVSVESMQTSFQETTAVLKEWGMETKEKKGEKKEENTEKNIDKANDTPSKETVPTGSGFVPDLPDDP